MKIEWLTVLRMPRLIAAAVLGAALAACQAPPPPVLAPFGDGVHWVLARNLRYTIADTGKTIVVPKGFITDLASIPRSLWSILSPIDNYLTAAIVHDYLYWDQRCTQLEADNVLYVGMLEGAIPR